MKEIDATESTVVEQSQETVAAPNKAPRSDLTKVHDLASQLIDELERVPDDRNWPWIDSPGVTVTPEGVVFTVEALSAERVQLVGDFNGWSVEGSDMERQGRYWRKVLNLGSGRHLYRFVVDGNWQSDPMNASVESCPGGHNSVLFLEDKSTEASIN